MPIVPMNFMLRNALLALCSMHALLLQSTSATEELCRLFAHVSNGGLKPFASQGLQLGSSRKFAIVAERTAISCDGVKITMLTRSQKYVTYLPCSMCPGRFSSVTCLKLVCTLLEPKWPLRGKQMLINYFNC